MCLCMLERCCESCDINVAKYLEQCSQKRVMPSVNIATRDTSWRTQWRPRTWKQPIFEFTNSQLGELLVRELENGCFSSSRTCNSTSCEFARQLPRTGKSPVFKFTNSQLRQLLVRELENSCFSSSRTCNSASCEFAGGFHFGWLAGLTRCANLFVACSQQYGHAVHY